MIDVDVAVTGGLVVTEAGAAPLSVGIREGRISALVADPGALRAREEAVDARGLVVLPGVVEPHCHFWDPGPTEREDWRTGTAAAAAGGVTTCIEMPLSDPPTVDRDAFALKQRRAAEQAVVDYALWGGIVPASLPALAERLRDMRALGAVAYKAFMCWSATDYPPVDDGVLLAAMREIAAQGALLGLHAENDAIIAAAEAALAGAGRTDPQAHVASRPEIAEVEAIERAGVLAEATGARLYVVHVSSAAGVAAAQRVRARGVRITIETAPQYLTLDAGALDARGPYAKCAPPLRSRATVEALWEHVLAGRVDTIGSDHAPFTAAEKDAGRDDIWRAPNGLPGVQTMLPLVLSEGVHRRGLPLERVAALLSGTPARTFGLHPRKGAIAVGADGDLALVDLEREWTVSDAALLQKNRWSPYAGMTLRGQVVRTLVRGRTVYADGQLVGAAGEGRQVRPGAATAPSRSAPAPPGSRCAAPRRR